MAARGKRGATTELNHDNWDKEEEETPQDPGQFQAAKPEQLAGRVLKKAKRRTGGVTDVSNGSSATTGSLFAGFGGFAGSKTPVALPSFTANAKTSTPTALPAFASTPVAKSVAKEIWNAQPAEKRKKIEPEPTKSSKAVSSEIGASLSADDQSKFGARVASLNRSVLDWAAKHVKEDACVDLQPVFADYAKHMDKVYQQFNLPVASTKPPSTTAAPPTTKRMPDFSANLANMKYNFGPIVTPSESSTSANKPLVFAASKTTMPTTATETPSKWECVVCMVRNKADACVCACCQADKPGSTAKATSMALPTFGAKKTTPVASVSFGLPSATADSTAPAIVSPFAFGASKTATTPAVGETSSMSKTTSSSTSEKTTTSKWECSSCMVMNEAKNDACVCCTTANPNAAKSTPKKWECGTCLVRNEGTVDKCVACTTANPDAAKTTVTSLFGGSAKAPPKASPFSFGLKPSSSDVEKPGCSSTAAPSFGLSSSTSAVTTPPMFGLSAPAAATATTTAPFSFGLGGAKKDTATTTGAPAPPFSFGLKTTTDAAPAAAKPFSFAGVTAQAPTASETPDETAYVPPTSEETEHEETDALHSVKCKVFYMDATTAAYKDRGVGMLHLKKADDGKLQLVVRTTTATGQLLLNVHMGMSVTRTGANNVSFVCMPNPPIGKATPVPTTMLIRVKTADDADTLKRIIDENQE